MENLTRQSLPSDDYLRLLGTSLCVFNANNAFIIENILGASLITKTWYDLMDCTSGRLHKHIANTITIKAGNTDIADLFEEVVDMRDRIIHSFQITADNDEQKLATKTRTTHEQFDITEDYLRDFIKKNECLCDMLHGHRGF